MLHMSPHTPKGYLLRTVLTGYLTIQTTPTCTLLHTQTTRSQSIVGIVDQHEESRVIYLGRGTLGHTGAIVQKGTAGLQGRNSFYSTSSPHPQQW